MVLLLDAIKLGAFEHHLGRFQNRTKVETFCFPVINRMDGVEQVYASDHLIDCPNADAGHNFSKLRSHHKHIVQYVFWLAFEFFPQLRILGGGPYGAGVQMALAHHDAAERDKRCG